MIDCASLSFSPMRAMFLGSPDKIIVCGNQPSTNVQVQYAPDNRQAQHESNFQVMSNMSLNGVCTDVELCGVPRLAQTFAVVAEHHQALNHSTLSLLNVETLIESAEITHTNGKVNALKNLLNAFNMDSYIEPADVKNRKVNILCTERFNITTVSFCSDLELLAYGNESGTVSILDIHTGKVVSTLKTDPCGVNKIKFTRAGQLITVGSSSKSQIKLWDLQASSSTGYPVLHLGQQLPVDPLGSGGRRNGGGGNYYSGTGNSGPTTTSLGVHPVQERLISGTSDGAVHLWDLRSVACMSFQPHAPGTSG
jgi:WD40 repeat protein